MSNYLKSSDSFSYTKYVGGSDKYKATRLWERAVGIFSGIPLSTNKQGLRLWKKYESTFVGTEGVNWFHSRLKEEFGELERVQVVLLLDKFLKAGVFVPVEGDPGGVFKDDKRVYRLMGEPQPEEMKMDYVVECVPLENESVELIWGECLTRRLNRMLGQELAELYADALQGVKGQYVQQNFQQGKELIPNWLRTAMIFLTKGEGSLETGFCYVNFGSDTLRLIKDYYVSYVGLRGEIPFGLYTQAFISTEQFDFNSRVEKRDNSVHHRPSTKYPFSRSDSTDKLLFDMLSPKGGPREEGVSSQNQFYFETAFLAASPITRVISRTELRGHREETLDRVQGAGGGPPDEEKGCYFNPSLSLSPGDLINDPRFAGVKRRLFGKVPKRSLSAEVLTGGGGGDEAIGSGMKLDAGLLTREGLAKGVETFRLLTLMLSPSARAHLKALLIFMKGMAGNKKRIDVGVDNRGVMLGTFTRLILEPDYDPHLSKRIVAFLMDNVEAVFNLDREGEPGGVAHEANKEISERQVKKVPRGKENFCRQISVLEYESQKYEESNRSLRALLQTICEKEDGKPKRKMIKKFSEEYPHIYAEKFGAVKPRSILKTFN